MGNGGTFAVEGGYAAQDVVGLGFGQLLLTQTGAKFRGKLLYNFRFVEYYCTRQGFGQPFAFARHRKIVLFLPFLHQAWRAPERRLVADYVPDHSERYEIVFQLQNGCTKGFQGKAGKTFNACLALDRNFNIGFKFRKEKSKPPKKTTRPKRKPKESGQ